ncbi:MAG: 16S rRNA (guanine(966)-N(2))-methyltransferase RsmD [Oscillospiraceae bacterium]|nr:16S rRNA (guanine(966)-N(2))-methyltransferase RsmD [Oscillospiraceae bacterium]
MRVITGRAKGIPLKSLKGNDTRPTSDKIKETMFSAIQFELEDAVVADLFAGSGQLGIEAVSRGAKKAYFADNNSAAVTVVKENLAKTGLSSNAETFRLPYNAFLRLCKEGFDIAFVDPPYYKGIIGKVFPLLIPKMNPSGIIICEHEKELNLPDNLSGFTVDKVYCCGSVTLTIYRS